MLGIRPHHNDPEDLGLLVKIELSTPRVKIALVSRSALELSRETDRSEVCRSLCRTRRPAETGEVEQRERWFGRPPPRGGMRSSCADAGCRWLGRRDVAGMMLCPRSPGQVESPTSLTAPNL